MFFKAANSAFKLTHSDEPTPETVPTGQTLHVGFTPPALKYPLLQGLQKGSASSITCPYWLVGMKHSSCDVTSNLHVPDVRISYPVPYPPGQEGPPHFAFGPPVEIQNVIKKTTRYLILK